MSRVCKYEEWLTQEGLLRVMGWAREGLSDGEIAGRMEISASTFREWRRKHAELAWALRRGRAPLDVEAENALLKAAMGYTVTLRKPFKLKQVTTQGGARTETERIEYADEQVHVPAKPTAGIFLLRNRGEEGWDGDDPLAEVLRRWDEG